MSAREILSGYSLARRATLATVATLVVILALAGLVLAAVFLKAQIENSRVSALTKANVASSTIAAAVRFGGRDVIAESLRVFDTGDGHDSVAVYARNGQLIEQLVAPGEARFPPQLATLAGLAVGVVEAQPVQYPLLGEVSGNEQPLLATLVVNPNQSALRAVLVHALTVLAAVLGVAWLAGLLVAQSLVRAMLRPVAQLTAWAEAVAATHNLAAAAPRGGGLEVNRLTTSFEALVGQVAEQNRELKRRQYELKESNAHLESIAFSDSLTGLPNRAMFEATLASAVESANAGGRPLAVLFVDLDDLKAINDEFGHDKGDAALCATAARLRRALRATDFLARLAGDEFVVISPNVSSAEDAVKLGERLAVWLSISLPGDEWTNPVRASIGVAVFPDHGADVSMLMRAADHAMYRAKALPADESIRVKADVQSPRATPDTQALGNVITLPTNARKANSGKQ